MKEQCVDRTRGAIEEYKQQKEEDQLEMKANSKSMEWAKAHSTAQGQGPGFNHSSGELVALIQILTSRGIPLHQKETHEFLQTSKQAGQFWTNNLI